MKCRQQEYQNMPLYEDNSVNIHSLQKHIPKLLLLAIFKSRSFENSYIPENPRTSKPLTFSKNRLRETKNRSNLRPVAKFFFRKNNFFFSKTLHMCKKKKKNCAYVYVLRFCFKNVQIPENFLKIFYRSLYNTYLKANFNDSKRFEESRSRFFERNNSLGDIGNWRSSRTPSSNLGNVEFCVAAVWEITGTN
ncbi:hypothetical protein LXL04_027127 [Taraxacum kok-saghyz]